MCGMCFQRQISHLGGNKLIRCLLALRWKTVSPTCFGKLQEQHSIKRQSKAQVVVCVGSYCSAIWEEIPRVVCARLGTTWEFWQVASIHTNTLSIVDLSSFSSAVWWAAVVSCDPNQPTLHLEHTPSSWNFSKHLDHHKIHYVNIYILYTSCFYPSIIR